jgi:hypothetical protein
MEHDPFASIPGEIIEALLEEMEVRQARRDALSPPHVTYRRKLKRYREAMAMFEAMEHPTEDDLHRIEHVIYMLDFLEEQGEPLPPLPDAKFKPTPPGIQ